MNSPTEQHLGTAFRDLVAEQPFTPDVPAIEHRARQARRRDRIVRGGIGAGVVAAAAAAAIGVASIVPSAPARIGSGRPCAPGEGRPIGRIGSAQQPLVQAGRQCSRRAAAAGNATLVERETGMPGGGTVNVWDLYTDNGRYFFSRTKAGCRPRSRRTTTRAAAYSHGKSPPRPTR